MYSELSVQGTLLPIMLCTDSKVGTGFRRVTTTVAVLIDCSADYAIDHNFIKVANSQF